MDADLQKLSIPEIHEQNQILWGALNAGVVLVLGILTWLVMDSEKFLDPNILFQSVTGISLVVLTGIAGMVVPKIMENKLKKEKVSGLKEKFIAFRMNFVFNASIFEGLALISAVIYFLEENIFFVFLVLVNLSMLYFARPTLAKFKQWYTLTIEENQELKANFPNEVI